MTERLKLKVSVIVPVLNNVQGFKRCLHSIFNQNGEENIDIIVIDGGSTDGTLDTVNTYSDKISYWESGKDSGISDAFNRGVYQASGDLVAILNSDDYWEPDTVSNVIKIASEKPQFDIYYGALRFHDIRSSEQYILKSTLNGIQRRMTLFHPSIFIRKQAYEKVGVYNTSFKYAMDSEWIHRAIKNELTFLNIPSVLANMSLGGVSDTNFVKSLAEYRKSLITHRLQSPISAWVYFLFYSMAKTVMQIDYVRTAYRSLTNKVES